MAPRFLNFLCASVTLFAAALASPAPDGNSLLFFKEISGAEKSIAIAAGFTVVELDKDTWPTLTTADVATYKAIVLGDQFCAFSSPAVLDVVEKNRAVWSPAITGNVVVIGTDPSYHQSEQPGAKTLMNNSIRFAASEAGNLTGAYISLSCYYGAAPETTVTVLDQFGVFRVRGNLDCYNKAHIVATHPAIDTLSDADISNWSCSVHEILFEFPTNFAPLAIAKDITGSGNRTFIDGTSGVPYIIARGVKVEGCGNKVLDVGEECDDGNLEDGDGCSSTCRIETVKPEKCEKCSPHPGENLCDDTTSCSNTPYGTMCACRPGYKANATNTDTSIHWRLKWVIAGHEHRVYVKPGTVCNELCEKWYTGASGCAEITEVAECKK